jgi:selenocysteine-specific translation elongation factor
LEGYTIGVFGADKELKTKFEGSIAKKSEVEGMIVYHRNEAGKRYSFLDDPQFPDKIQGYSRIASISDYACYLFPPNGRLSAPDGELAVLLESFKLPGRVEIVDGTAGPEDVKTSFKGLSVAAYPVESRSGDSSVIDLSGVESSSPKAPQGGLVYIDRSFSVKGVGTVVLGFVLSGTVKVHDKLRAVASSPEKTVEIKGIQVNDEDQESAGRGLRVGLSLKGVDAKELDKVSWLDDGSFKLTDKIRFAFSKSAFYKQDVVDRDLHIQLPGEMVLASIAKDADLYTATVPSLVPVWEGMRLAVLDLNGKNLRVAGGGVASAAP